MLIFVLIIIGFCLGLCQSPFGVWRTKLEADVQRIRDELKPSQQEINRKFKGEEAHTALLELYKRKEISLFFEMRPMAPMLFQITLMVIVINSIARSQFLIDIDLEASFSIFKWLVLSPSINELMVLAGVFLCSLLIFFFSSTTRNGGLVSKDILRIIFFSAILAVLPLYISLTFMSSFITQNRIISLSFATKQNRRLPG